MNVTAVETLERRLKATRDAMAGELDRARNAAREAAKAEARAADYQPIIRDLEAAILELRSLMPAPEPAPTPDPLTVPCPSCQARAGDPCRSPTGETVEPHATRRAPG